MASLHVNTCECQLKLLALLFITLTLVSTSTLGCYCMFWRDVRPQESLLMPHQQVAECIKSAAGLTMWSKQNRRCRLHLATFHRAFPNCVLHARPSCSATAIMAGSNMLVAASPSAALLPLKQVNTAGCRALWLDFRKVTFASDPAQ